jgi:hypothetical protein
MTPRASTQSEDEAAATVARIAARAAAALERPDPFAPLDNLAHDAGLEPDEDRP